MLESHRASLRGCWQRASLWPSVLTGQSPLGSGGHAPCDGHLHPGAQMHLPASTAGARRVSRTGLNCTVLCRASQRPPAPQPQPQPPTCSVGLWLGVGGRQSWIGSTDSASSISAAWVIGRQSWTRTASQNSPSCCRESQFYVKIPGHYIPYKFSSKTNEIISYKMIL